MTNEELIHDFIHQRGTFSQDAIENYVDPYDLRSARYHHDAGCRFQRLAKSEASRIELERLNQKANQHFHELKLILQKYDC